MKANQFILVGITLSVLMSGLSLAWQVNENAPFAKFFRPLSASNITEAEFRSLKADFMMLQAHVSPLSGIYPGELSVSYDRETATILVGVLSAS